MGSMYVQHALNPNYILRTIPPVTVHRGSPLQMTRGSANRHPNVGTDFTNIVAMNGGYYL